MTKQQELIKELESLAGKMRIPKHRRRSEQILIELKKIFSDMANQTIHLR